MKLKHKDLLCIHDLSTEEVLLILDVAKKLKKMQKLGVPHEFCKGKTLAMMFSKASTRTRVSFETGFHQLGVPVFLLRRASISWAGTRFT